MSCRDARKRVCRMKIVIAYTRQAAVFHPAYALPRVPVR